MSDRITSRKNPKIARLRRLLRHSSERRAENVWLLEGPKLATEFLGSGGRPIAIYSSEDFPKEPANKDLWDQLDSTHVTTYLLAGDLLAWVSTLEATQGLILEIEAPSLLKTVPAPPGVLAIGWGLQDPGNLGSLARVVEGSGAVGLALMDSGVDPGNPKALRASAGSLLRLPLWRGGGSTLLDQLESAGWKLVATVANAETSYTELDWREPWAVIFGEEGRGIPSEVIERAEARIQIPMHRVESLNVSTSAAIILFEAARTRT